MGLSSRDKTRRAHDAPTRSKDDFSFFEAKKKKKGKISFYIEHHSSVHVFSTRVDSKKKIRNDTQEGVHKM